MDLIECSKVGPGIRSDERAVSVSDVRGFDLKLRVQESQLESIEGKTYLVAGVVAEDTTKGMLLVELPHEADNGSSRLWAWRASVRRLESGSVA